jgi:protein-S-isoprenylcysteine O-methyltransferase Ste14
MDQRTMILVGVVVIAIVVVIAALFIERKRRSERLKQQFGPEYDRTLRQHGDASHAEAALLER